MHDCNCGCLMLCNLMFVELFSAKEDIITIVALRIAQLSQVRQTVLVHLGVATHNLVVNTLNINRGIIDSNIGLIFLFGQPTYFLLCGFVEIPVTLV